MDPPPPLPPLLALTQPNPSPAGSSSGSPASGDLRLVSPSGDGSVTTVTGSGLLQVYYDGVWGTVAHSDSWPWANSKAACTQLGFAHAHSAIDRVRHDNTALPQWVQSLTCQGTEAHLLNQCAHNALGPPPVDNIVWDVVIRCVAGEFIIIRQTPIISPQSSSVLLRRLPMNTK